MPVMGALFQSGYSRHPTFILAMQLLTEIVTFHRSRVYVTAPLINYQTMQIPLNLIEHFVKRLGLRETFNANIHLSVS